MAEKSGLIRNIKYLLYNIKTTAYSFLLIPVICIFFSKMYGDTSGTYMTFMIFILIPMLQPISSYTVQYKYVVGFGSTRKNFYLSNLINSGFYAVITVVLWVVTNLILNSFSLNSPLQILYMFIFALFMGILGTFYGILIYRSAKLGFAIYMISFMLIIFGAVFYGIFAELNMEEAAPFNFNFWESFISNPIVIVIIIAAGIIFAVINRLISKNLEIKS